MPEVAAGNTVSGVRFSRKPATELSPQTSCWQKGGLAKTTFEDYVDQIVKAGGKHPAVLVGASMGGVLVLKAAEKLKPGVLVLVCSATPAGVGKKPTNPYPLIIKWANGPYADTVGAMPDSTEAARKFAFPRWRDESGSVLNALSKGVEVKKPVCPTLSVIPEADDTVAPADQEAIATWAHADTLRFQGMSHVGTLMSRRGAEVARAVLTWIRERK